MNIKKLFAVSAIVTFVGSTFLNGLALAATPDNELGKAYEWAYANGITTMGTYEAANMTAPITRAEMAKMLSNYAKKFQNATPDTSKECSFGDTKSIGGDLAVAIIESCQLGIMGQGITNFRPYDTITRAEFGTALSRVLWEGKYEGGNPYYALHLNALQSAGIMKVIANAESTKEIRGYVMLMLMRASEGSEPAKADCEDPMIKAACLLDSDKCPAECKGSDEKEDNTVVKSGDLAVTAKAAEGRKALIGGVSDLDTITFKTSEDVTISSITLERYGYSTIDDVVSVQLEDEDGNIIADAKEPNSKGQVKLTLKKDYKTVDGTFKATVVVTTRTLPGAAPYDDAKLKNGSTLGFKVIAAESTAKNLNLDDYSPYTYDLVNYKGSAVQFSSRNSATKDYNFEANKLYEVAKFRVKAPADAAILVKGFTLTDKDTTKNAIDADKFAKDVTVTFNGKEVSGLKWKFNKDEELVVSFDEVEIAGKETATIAVNMSFNEEFDNFGASSKFYISELSNFNAIDKKTETRVSQDETLGDDDKPLYTVAALKDKMTTYKFNGGKIKISGKKLGTVNAAAGATNVKIAEWEITVSEAIRWSAIIVAKTVEDAKKIDEIRLVINGEEYDGSKGADWKTYTFKWLEIEKSGKIEIRVDIKSDMEDNIEFDGSLNSASFISGKDDKGNDVSSLKYDETGEVVDLDQITGSLSVSTIKIQAARANLNNKTTKKAELVINENNRKTIFEGTYEAKKGTVTLKNFVITSTSDADLAILWEDGKFPTFYVTIDKEEYDANWAKNNCEKKTVDCAKWDIDDIEIADGKSVNVKVEIEYTPKFADPDELDDDDLKAMFNTFNLALEWEDEDNNPAGKADEDTVRVEVVKQWTIDITDTSAKKTVLLKSNREVATFKIKPSKSSDDDIILNELVFDWADSSAKTDWVYDSEADWKELKFDIDDDSSYKHTDGTFSKLGISVPAEGVLVKVTLKSEPNTATKRFLNVVSINWKKVNSEFSKYFVPAIVKITQNNGKGKDTTQYTAVVDNDTSLPVSNLKLYYNAGTDQCTFTNNEADTANCKEAAKKADLSEWSEGNKFSATNTDGAHTITAVQYMVGDDYVEITKDDFENFFEEAYCASSNNCDDLMVYSNKS